MPQVQQIFTDRPGSASDTYTIPPTLELVLSSVVAKVDGSGAGAEYLPTLEILSQEGKVMARVRPDKVFAAGDTGVVTYAPF